MKGKRARLNLWAATMLVVAVSACSPSPGVASAVGATVAPLNEPPLQVPTTALSLEPGKPVLIVYSHGGLCANGNECQRTVTLFGDGSYVVRGGIKGNIPAKDLDQLRALIDQTDFAAVKSVPFADVCPVAYDGQETVYTFTLRDGTQETIASCRYKIDPSLPLFQWVDRWVRTIG